MGGSGVGMGAAPALAAAPTAADVAAVEVVVVEGGSWEGDGGRPPSCPRLVASQDLHTASKRVLCVVHTVHTQGLFGKEASAVPRPAEARPVREEGAGPPTVAPSVAGPASGGGGPPSQVERDPKQLLHSPV